MKQTNTKKTKNNDMALSANALKEKREWFMPLVPIILFSAVTIMIVRMHIYTRPMGQFFWTTETDSSQITDFFSYWKMVLIIASACFALILILFQLLTRSLVIKRSKIYIPMAVYTAFVIISYYTSEFKKFALWGYNDRFEGTVTLICYMLMLFFTISNINTEKGLKKVFWALAIMSVLLGILGISQGIGHDFFRTTIGQKLITPNYELSDGYRLWDAIDDAAAQGKTYFNFTFKNKEIYQTVYNINYVSFYLTLLIPLFGMLFIRAFDKKSKEPIWKTGALLVLFGVLIYNFIASKSAGGYFGLGVIGVIGIVMLNKQLLAIWKPLAMLFLVTGIVFGLTTEIWLPEITNTFAGLNKDSEGSINTEYAYANKKPFVDYIITGDTVEFSINGELLIIATDAASFIAKDADGTRLSVNRESDGYFSINDERFYDYVKLGAARDSKNQEYLVVNTAGDTDWYFVKNDGQFYYVNGLGKLVSLDKVEHIGFRNHLGFGSRRGYIWAASLPLLKNTLVTGYGADVFCCVFPHQDYAWKYNSRYNRDIIVDKPHNMYIHAAICTGGISVCALVAIYGIYVVQSIKLFWKRKLGVDYLHYAGFGIFCGVTAFMVTGLVDDSTVSVMPLFYTLLGCGIAVNEMIRTKDVG